MLCANQKINNILEVSVMSSEKFDENIKLMQIKIHLQTRHA